MLLVQNLHPIGGVDIAGDRQRYDGGDMGSESDGLGLERGGAMRMQDNHDPSNHNLALHIQHWHRLFVDCEVRGSSSTSTADDREDPCELGGTRRTTHQLSGDVEEMIDMVLEYRKESCVLLQTIYTTWPG